MYEPVVGSDKKKATLDESQHDGSKTAAVFAQSGFCCLWTRLSIGEVEVRAERCRKKDESVRRDVESIMVYSIKVYRLGRRKRK